jgi:hypothetical protein
MRLQRAARMGVWQRSNNKPAACYRNSWSHLGWQCVW